MENLSPSQQDFSTTQPESNSKFYKLAALIIFIFVATTIATATFLLNNSKQNNLPGEPLESPLSTTAPEITPTPAPETPLPVETKPFTLNLLLLGKGGEGHSGGHLSDSIILAVINPLSLKISLISIPRDTYVEVSQPKKWMKINNAFAVSPTDAKIAVASVTGQNVDYYISIDFDRFIRLIDYLGGINVNIPGAFTDPFYPIKGEENNICGKSVEELERVHKLYSGFELEKQFTCRYETLSFPQGQFFMDGQTTLKFLRSRHSAQNGSDFARIQRSVAVLTSLYATINQKLTSTDINSLFTTLRNFVQTDLTINILNAFTSQYPGTNQYTIAPLPLESSLFKNAVSSSGEYILEPTAGRGGWGPIQDYINSRL